jgi:peptide/nickel transport system permease protein
MVLLWVFAIWLGVLPLYGNIDLGASGIYYFTSVIVHAVLPIVTLGLSIFGESYLLLRGSALESLKSDYVLAARSRGLYNRLIATKYVLRNSMIPLISIMSFSLASLVSRLVLVEAVFGYPGIGDLIIDAVRLHDYPVIEGSLFYLTIFVIAGGLVGDFVLIRIDPRLRT